MLASVPEQAGSNTTTREQPQVEHNGDPKDHKKTGLARFVPEAALGDEGAGPPAGERQEVQRLFWYAAPVLSRRGLIVGVGSKRDDAHRDIHGDDPEQGVYSAGLSTMPMKRLPIPSNSLRT